MNTATHTPTPWEACGWDIRDMPTANDRGGMSGGLMIATTRDSGHRTDQVANAAFIVRAVNAHDDLVSALKMADAWIRQAKLHGCKLPSDNTDARNRAALAKAGA